MTTAYYHYSTGQVTLVKPEVKQYHNLPHIHNYALFEKGLSSLFCALETGHSLYIL